MQNNRPSWPQNRINAGRPATFPRCGSPPRFSRSLQCDEPLCPPICEPECLKPACPPICEPECHAPVCPPVCGPTCHSHPTCRPNRPSLSQKLTTPYVVCCGREADRCFSETISVDGLPCCGLCPPLTLKSLEVSNETPKACVKQEARGPSSALVEVTVPLVAWVCDANGRLFCGDAQITVCVRMPTSCASCDGALMAAARIRLIDPGCTSCTATFCVRLDAVVEVFVIRIDSGARKCNQFPMLNMPMFPQPFYPL